MRKNDEQKVNKLKKEKVKKEKTKKIPKRDNASRKEKKIKMKESSGGRKKEKSEITLFRLVEIPRDISFNGITAHIHQLFNPVLPVFRDCSEIMERARDDFKRLSV